jgi:hypothetical protein
LIHSTESYAEIDGVEQKIKVFYEVQPAEPDVGIFRAYIEITGAYAKPTDPAERVKNRLLGEKDEFTVDVSNQVDDDALHDQIQEELNIHGDY